MQPSIRVFLVLLFCASPVLAQSGNQNKPLSNNDIIEMSRAGVPQSAIISAIDAGSAKFDVSPEGIVALHTGGVSEAVLNRMIRGGARPKTGSFGVATGSFPVKDALGKTVHYSAWIKTENVMNGYAGLWWRVDGEERGKVLAFDNSQARIIGDQPSADSGAIRGATGTTGWTRYEFDLPVAAGARNINFGLLFTGTGTAWFDTLSITLDGSPYVNSQTFDFDFESPVAKGFYTGGDGYKVQVDNTTALNGRQSLKMRYVGDGGEGNASPSSQR
jgi:hypothetical protein